MFRNLVGGYNQAAIKSRHQRSAHKQKQNYSYLRRILKHFSSKSRRYLIANNRCLNLRNPDEGKNARRGVHEPDQGFLLLLNCLTNNAGSITLLVCGMAVNPAPAARTGR